MGVVVNRPVRVKVVVTERFKTQRSAEIRAALSKLEGLAKRLDFKLDRGTGKPDPEAQAVMERLRGERRNNERARLALVRELEKVSELEIGSEYRRGTLQGTVDVEVGDDFSKLGICEIVVKDDKVIEIRDGLCPDECETSS